MKIMRRDSRTQGYPARAGAPSICPGTHSSHSQEMHMTWQTPRAQDFRFGFEITMYVAAR
jgi:coenzyme PQQ precursor peptide PqqA